MARGSSGLMSLLLLAGGLASLAGRAAFVPSARTLGGTASYASAAAAAGAASPALANAGEEPEGFLNFGKIELGGGFELNLDIPETGIVNIAVLIGGLLYLLGPLLSESMATREKEIQTDIDDAIAKFGEASTRLAEAQKAQAQADEVIAEINASIEKDKKEFEATLMASMEASLKKQEAQSAAQLASMEAGAAARVEAYIQAQAISRGVKELEELKDAQKKTFMDKAIEAL